MLARCTKIEHPLGGTIDLPRLVPAFSSKGFAFIPADGDGRLRPPTKKKGRTKPRFHPRKGVRSEVSEATRALETVGPLIRDSILVSAYDLHHHHFRKPERFFEGKELVFLDSGGYELSPGFDQTEPVHWGTPKKQFLRDDYLAVLQQLPKNLPFAISNYDWGTKGRPLEKQILDAQRLFQGFPNCMTNFIAKPTGGKYVDVDELIHHVKKLRAFNILGLTEKELGKELIDQLMTLAKLRSAMDREGVNLPIHIWGGLDPLLTPLYFFAGAEIFDGISWLRYAYHDGIAVYRDSYSVLEGTIECPKEQAKALALHKNLDSLRVLASNLRDFVLRKASTFEMFGSRKDVLEKAYRTLATRLPANEGAR